MFSKRKLIALGLLAGCSLLQGVAMAQTAAAPATIVRIHTGWDAEQFRIETSAGRPVLNPANCLRTDGYILHSSFAGYQTNYQLVLAAYAQNKPVTVTISNSTCWNDRPVILGLAF
ncbi:hypothetical protein ACI2IY_13425 [Lysobacter enzymogenes]|uniref:hypothetical protein n=1 Tax=Lysobacter enzymogenes TaxID=69 RepID=UPI00384B1483